MCRVSFYKVGQLLREFVDLHGGVLVATPGEIKRDIQGELGDQVDPSAIDHFPLALARWGMAISPYGDTPRGAVVMLRDVKKHPLVKDVLRLSSVHIAPEAKVVLNEHKHAVAV